VILTTPANRQECLYLEVLLPMIPSALQRVIDEQVTPPIVHGDMGYDIPRCYDAIATAGYIADIPERYVQKETPLGKIRWHIERTFAWLNNFRRLLIRYERTEEMYLAFLKLGCIVICLRRLLAKGF
jgi:transposase